ncbi:MAG: hypothetical protein ABIQ64_00440 [Candidatus Saccharimonadales bacterium]
MAFGFPFGLRSAGTTAEGVAVRDGAGFVAALGAAVCDTGSVADMEAVGVLVESMFGGMIVGHSTGLNTRTEATIPPSNNNAIAPREEQIV